MKIPLVIDPRGAYWQQPIDIAAAPMDDTHVLLTPHQYAQLLHYDSSYPTGTYDGKCWVRHRVYLCWYFNVTPQGAMIDHRQILVVQ